MDEYYLNHYAEQEKASNSLPEKSLCKLDQLLRLNTPLFKHYDEIFRYDPSAVIVVSQGFEIVYANSSAFCLFQDQLNDVTLSVNDIKLKCYQCIHKMSHVPLSCVQSSLFVEGTQSGKRDIVVGEKVVSLEAYRTPLGDIVHRFLDKTREKQMNLQMMQENHSLEQMFQKIPVGAFVTDVSWKFLEVNELACTMLGFSRGELESESVRNVLSFEKLNMSEEQFQDMITGNQPHSFDLQLIKKDGTTLDVRLEIVPLLEDKRMIFFKDISSEHEEKESQVEKDFIYQMSHVFRNLLHPILGYSDTLVKRAQTNNDGAYLEEATVLKAQSALLLEVINNVLDLSDVVSIEHNLMRTSVPVKKLFENILSGFTLRAMSKKNRLSLEFSENLPDALVVDSLHMHKILGNIIDNANNFTEGGSVEVKIDAEYADSLKSMVSLHIKVCDTGIGIAPDKIPFIFDPFVQHNRPMDYKGTGLGLTISKKLVDMYGGMITVTSEPGKGSTFEVTLPNILTTMFLNNNKKEYKEVEEELSGTILAVDDEILNQMVLKSYLGHHDKLKICAVKSGNAALDFLEKNDCDVILMDMKMPGKDGLETTQEIKSREFRGKKIDAPVILVTASPFEEVSEKLGETSFESLFCEYLGKPYADKDIEMLLRKHLPKNPQSSNLHYVVTG